MANSTDAAAHLGPAVVVVVVAGLVSLVWLTVGGPMAMLLFSGQRAASSSRERASSPSAPTWALPLRPRLALGPAACSWSGRRVRSVRGGTPASFWCLLLLAL